MGRPLSENASACRGAFPDLPQQAKEAGVLTILRRILRYGDKVVHLTALLCQMTDRRKRPRIPTRLMAGSVLVMLLCRLGSLHALEKAKASSFWRRWLQAPLPSADSIGRVYTLVDPDTVRGGIHQIYARLKRNKAIVSSWQCLIPLVVDGHESHASYRRHCDGCLRRTIRTEHGEKTQYYHRHVSALLVSRDFALLLDAEPQRPEEDEVAAAIRLLDRLIARFPRAFDVVLGDALYTDPRFYQFLIQHGKEVLTVLKDQRRDLIQDALALFAGMEPTELTLNSTRAQCWDVEGLTSWSQLDRPVRVIHSQERSHRRRQLDDQIEENVSCWMWVTTLSQRQATTLTTLKLGHSRWSIENEGFNEMVNHWSADHVYKHESTAMLVFWLMTMIAYNLFQAFFFRNLKAVLHSAVTKLHIARLISSELYQGIPSPIALPP